MYQEKCDVYGGGIYRYIPKVKPFFISGEKYDFSTPRNTSQNPFPQDFYLTNDLWENSDSPPDRQIDFIKNLYGNNLIGFAGGFLPLCDGTPCIRKNNITHASRLSKTRKTYPTFANGEVLKSVHGVAYKKYFSVEDTSSSVYSVQYNDSVYLFVDFFKSGNRRIDLNGATAKLLEKSDKVAY